jgi:colanic acid biosynthesis protein WcaH
MAAGGPIPRALYAQVLEHLPIVCVDVVVRDGCGRVLLVRRADEPAKGDWWFPGGRLLEGEALADCAARKCREEVGLPVRVLRRIGTYETTFPRAPFPEVTTGVHSVNVCFLVERTGPEDGGAPVALDDTSADHRWVAAPEPELPAYVHEVLRDAGVW